MITTSLRIPRRLWSKVQNGTRSKLQKTFCGSNKPFNKGATCGVLTGHTKNMKSLRRQRQRESTINPNHKCNNLIHHEWMSHIYQASRSFPWWRQSDLEFGATLDEDFIGVESSLEAEISVSNLPLYNLFVGKKKKKNCYVAINMNKLLP